MKDDVKARILETAKRLFAEQGYNQVSMRDIANTLGMSVGNLTYHYKKKEDLIEAALMEERPEYKSPAPARTLEELQAFFERQFAHHRENAYYFRHYRQLAQISSHIYDKQVKVMGEFLDMLRKTFAGFVQSGLMQPEELPDQYDGTALALMSLSIFGVLPIHDQKPGLRLAAMWDILYPAFTVQGKAVYREQIAPALEAAQ